MVTNTASTATTETSNTQENGEPAKESSVNEGISNLKQNSDVGSKISQVEKVSGVQENDASVLPNSMSHSHVEASDTRKYQAPAPNGLPNNSSYNARTVGNGGVVTSSVSMNGPPQAQPGVSSINYGPYNHHSTGYPGKTGIQSMSNAPAYHPSMQQGYPNQQTGSTPTLNQLLTTPSKYPTQYAGYSNHAGGQQQQKDYNPNAPQSWQPRSQQYGRSQPDQQQMKPDAAGYSQQQYPLPQQHPGYPPNQGRYPALPSAENQPPYNQTQQYSGTGTTSIHPSGPSGYPSSSTPSRGHPSYAGYSSYNPSQPSTYYGQRPPQPYNYPPTSYAVAPQSGDEGRSYVTPEQHPLSQGPDPTGSHSLKDQMMSPNRRTPQTPQPVPHPGSVQSPINANASPHIHHGHPGVAQLRGQLSAPGSPAPGVQPRSTPLSPPSVRPGTPQQQGPMRSSSEHSEHSSSIGHSPMPGQNYGQYRPHTASQPPNYAQHMMAPQQNPPTPQHQAPPRPHVPPSAGKPHQMHGGPSPNFNQSQQSPAFQQSAGGHMAYYDNYPPQHQHMMQGYNASSPAPAERRLSRQGSHLPSTQMPDQQAQQARQGAAAAAAAAMAAAAHTAQPANLPQKPSTPNYYPQQSRPPHPNYSNVQPSGEIYSQNMGYLRMPHPGGPSGPPQRMMGPPGMSGSPGQMHRMNHPPSHYPSGYPPSGPIQQSHYPGYYPMSSADSGHHQAMHQGYPPPNNYDGPPRSVEEPVKKPSARSASQKLATLYEPADEPGRREFIDSILRYWEEKDCPLKNAPLMGRKTLDLYRLYQAVKEKGFMQEVTNGKKWIEISTAMGLGSAATSGFTLKKQYCKYLYGFECKMERGECEPHEAMARITEANRKRKQLSDQQAQKEEAKSIPDPQRIPHTSSSVPPQYTVPMSSSPQHRFPSQQYPPGQYPPHMGHQYRPPNQAYPRPSMSGPPQGSYSQHPLGNMPPRPGMSSMPTYPAGQAPTSYGPHVPPNSGYQPQATATAAPPTVSAAQTEARQSTEAANAKRTEMPSAEMPYLDTQPVSSNQRDANLSVKPPVPTHTTLAAANPFNEAKVSQPVLSGTPANFPTPNYHGTPHQQYPSGPDSYRPNYPSRPTLPPSHYPYANRMSSSPTHPNVQGTRSPQGMSPRPTAGYPGSAPGISKPGYSRPGSYSGLQGPQYTGMKRPSSDMYAPPSKYIRPNGHPLHHSSSASYPPNHPSYRVDGNVMRHRYPPSSALPTHVTYSAPASNISVHVPSTPARSHLSYQQGYPNVNGPRTRDQAARPPVRWPHPAMPRRTNSPLYSPFMSDPRFRSTRTFIPRYTSLKPEMSPFPPDSVEATPLRSTKLQKKTCRDVGVIEGWRLVMALKSGMLVESTWALNALTVLLYDSQSVAQLRLTQLPGLLDALIDHYRRCLSELFKLPSEQDALGVSSCNYIQETKEMESLESNCPTVKPNLRNRKKKGCVASSRLCSKFTTLPVKFESRTDHFLTDTVDQWDTKTPKHLLDDLSHIVLSFNPDKPNDVVSGNIQPVEEVEGSMMFVEATLEDVLSIPMSVLSPDEFATSDMNNITESLDTTEISTSTPSAEKAGRISSECGENKSDAQEALTCAGIPMETNDVTAVEPPTNKPAADLNSETSDTILEEGLSNTNKCEVDKKDIVTGNESKPNTCLQDKHSLVTKSHSDVTEASEISTNETPIVKDEEERVSSSSVTGNNGTDSHQTDPKLEDLTNGNTDVGVRPTNELHNVANDSKHEKETLKRENLSDDKSMDTSSKIVCNGVEESSDTMNEDGSSEEETSKSKSKQVKWKETVSDEPCSETSKHKKETDAGKKCDLSCSRISVISKVERVLEERNVVLLEDEAVGADGDVMNAISGPVMCARLCKRQSELCDRLQCISNVLRGLSFIPSNINELCKQRHLMRALSGTLLLRHKHRARPKTAHNIYRDIDVAKRVPAFSCDDQCNEIISATKLKLQERESNDKSPFSLSNSRDEKSNFLDGDLNTFSDLSEGKTETSRLFAPKEEKTPESKKKRCHFSSIVYDNTQSDIYANAWWWDCIHKTREDSLVVLANISPALDLSDLPDDNVPLALLEACLHWSVCPSSDACDSFSVKSKYPLSVRKLALEILTKLSIKDQNVDLILATRPFSRIEKLFAYLVNLICDRRDTTLREFAIVLLSNLSMGEAVAARAIALQSGSISGLIGFLEECEEYGVNNRHMFPGQMSINCGTTVFMMSKAAKTLLSIAKISENKSHFAKHQLRLLSLSMSQYLGSFVNSIISSLLYELSHDTT